MHHFTTICAPLDNHFATTCEPIDNHHAPEMHHLKNKTLTHSGLPPQVAQKAIIQNCIVDILPLYSSPRLG
jgi:hypothetical protein